MMRINRLRLFVLIGMLLVPGAAVVRADPGTPAPLAVTNPSHAGGLRAVEAKDWGQAVALLRQAAEQDPRNADILNMLAYAYRNRGDLPSALRHYREALAIDPDHRGAHEYIGEAYLRLDDLARAEEHLAWLDRLCLFGCPEYTDLKNAIAAYKAGRKG